MIDNAIGTVSRTLPRSHILSWVWCVLVDFEVLLSSLQKRQPNNRPLWKDLHKTCPNKSAVCTVARMVLLKRNFSCTSHAPLVCVAMFILQFDHER